jgi:DNA-binding HxlR family transcriptional regulator
MEALRMSRQKKTTMCPAGMVGVGGKWKFWILYHLLSGTKRFGELQRLIPQASRQMLTIQLRELEQKGILHRQVYMQASPKVEYSLTELAWRLEPVFRQVYTWSRWYCEQAGLEFDWSIIFGGKWKFAVWYHLLSGTKRFSELQQLMPQATRQTLTVQLRELEQMGVLHRQAYVQVPPKVEYSLTELGRQSEPILRQMYAWGKWYCDQIGLEFDWPISDETADPKAHPPAETNSVSWELPLYSLPSTIYSESLFQSRTPV